jgi:hypothetical protein
MDRGDQITLATTAPKRGRDAQARPVGVGAARQNPGGGLCDDALR